MYRQRKLGRSNLWLSSIVSNCKKWLATGVKENLGFILQGKAEQATTFNHLDLTLPHSIQDGLRASCNGNKIPPAKLPFSPGSLPFKHQCTHMLLSSWNPWRHWLEVKCEKHCSANEISCPILERSESEYIPWGPHDSLHSKQECQQMEIQKAEQTRFPERLYLHF